MTAAMLPLRRTWTQAMRLIFLVLFLLAAPLAAGHHMLNVPAHLIDPGRPGFDDPDTLVHDYLKAVDRGELVVFGRRIERAMLVPNRVEYVYELSTRTTRVRIHSNLKDALPVPGQPDCTVRSVSAAVEDGRITDTESHVWIGH
jgi:hypothetical protein